MPKLYIANTTKQTHLFQHRLKDNQQKIDPGAQILVKNKELEESEVNDIIAHYGRHGMRSAQDAARTRGYVGLVYSIGEPVRLDAMFETFERNTEALNRQGQERLETQVAAIRESVEQTLQTPVKRVEASIEEVGTVKDPEAGGDLAVGIEVTREDVAPRHTEGRRSARGGQRLS